MAEAGMTHCRTRTPPSMALVYGRPWPQTVLQWRLLTTACDFGAAKPWGVARLRYAGQDCQLFPKLHLLVYSVLSILGSGTSYEKNSRYVAHGRQRRAGAGGHGHAGSGLSDRR